MAPGMRVQWWLGLREWGTMAVHAEDGRSVFLLWPQGHRILATAKALMMAH